MISIFSEQDFQTAWELILHCSCCQRFEEVRSSSQVVMNESIESVTVDISTSYTDRRYYLFFFFWMAPELYITMNVENSNFLIIIASCNILFGREINGTNWTRGKWGNAYPQYQLQGGMGDYSTHLLTLPFSFLWTMINLKQGIVSLESKNIRCFSGWQYCHCSLLLLPSDFIEYFQKQIITWRIG